MAARVDFIVSIHFVYVYLYVGFIKNFKVKAVFYEDKTPEKNLTFKSCISIVY